MLMAVAAGDRQSFERIWSWTRKELLVREDGLLAWRWAPGQGVTDRNNATDGDLLAAWALARAFLRWGKEADRLAARNLAGAIRTRLLRPSAFGLLMLPGREGFESPQGRVINLSYWVFPALRDLGSVDPAPEWQALESSGLALLDAARFGRWQLPADWMLVNEDKLTPAPGFPPRFGYDAIRIPLYLHWAGLSTSSRLASYDGFWAYFDGARFVPAWTMLSDDSVDTHGTSVGMRAVIALTRGKALPAFADEDYYSVLLQAFARLSARKALQEKHQ